MGSARNIRLVDQFERLSLVSPRNELEEVLAARRTETTINAYRTDWLRFSRWAEQHDRLEFPVSEETLIKYLLWLKRKKIARPTLARTMTVFRLLHAGKRKDPTQSIRVKEVYKGVKKLADNEPTKAHPITIAELQAMSSALLAKGLSYRASRNRAMITLGWFGALRPSEIVGLNWGDIDKVDQGIEIKIRESKTCKEPGGETIALPLLTIEHFKICPVRALKEIEPFEPAADEPVFTSGLHRLCSKMVGRVLKQAAELADLEIAVSGHSLRRGFATHFAYGGISERAMMRHGRWKTQAIMQGYVERAKIWNDNPILQLFF